MDLRPVSFTDRVVVSGSRRRDRCPFKDLRPNPGGGTSREQRTGRTKGERSKIELRLGDGIPWSYSLIHDFSSFRSSSL